MDVDRLDLLSDLESLSDVPPKATVVKPVAPPVQPAAAPAAPTSDVEDLDALTRRFEALKKR